MTSEDPDVCAAHDEITESLTGEHVTLVDADILAVIPDCDAMVTDVSSVGLDWLYLRTDRPLFIADRHDDPERLRLAAPVSRCADIVDSDQVHQLTELLTARLEHDVLHLARIAMRNHYFDDVRVGDSTAHFLDAVTELVTLRDTLLRGWVDDAIAT